MIFSGAFTSYKSNGDIVFGVLQPFIASNRDEADGVVHRRSMEECEKQGTEFSNHVVSDGIVAAQNIQKNDFEKLVIEALATIARAKVGYFAEFESLLKKLDSYLASM
jgi:hypothetical protein